jgi:hypothetical protein
VPRLRRWFPQGSRPGFPSRRRTLWPHLISRIQGLPSAQRAHSPPTSRSDSSR